jgi:protein O-GlcNAc transferase
VGHNDLGKTLLQQGDLAAAAACFERALALKPDFAEAHNNLGNALLEQGKLVEAVVCYRRAAALKPNLAEAHNNLGNALRQQGELADAVASCERALALAPDLAEAHNNCGAALQQQGKLPEAAACYKRALALKPDFAEAHNNLGTVRQQQGQLVEAAACYRRATALKPSYAEPQKNLADLLWERGQVADAIAACCQAIILKPDYPEAVAQLAHLKRHACDWRSADIEAEHLLAAMRRYPGTVPPFNLLSQSSTPGEQLVCARQWAKNLEIGQSDRFAHKRSVRQRKIHLGYLSADLRDHAVAYAIAELIEGHDRAIFDVSAYSYGPDDGSKWRRRLGAAFDQFTDLRAVGDEEAARQIHSDGVDILIDLTGYTGYARTRILAFRPAPVQVNFLGYLGTMGAEFVDYVLVDPFIVPMDQQPFYTERLVHLSSCWWPASTRSEVPEQTPSREECGLPPQGFVFCCFNNSYKLNPGFFEIWVRLLKAVPGSVLWLAEPNSLVKGNLRREAIQRGLAAERLVFASYKPIAKHLARHRLADLFLDTLPYNACGTAYDALWAGLPVLTCAGTTFAGRVAGTMLRTVGLPELITASLDEYEALALRLAKRPGLLLSLRERLARNRSTTRLFDSERSTGDIEAAYVRMWEIWRSGEDPQPFALS